MNDHWNLQDIDLFRDLSHDEINEALQIMPVVNYRAGEILFRTGEIANSLYLLQAGLVKVSYISLNGDEKILSIFHSGDIFGELFLGHYKHRIGEAQALDDIEVCRLTKDRFLMLVQRFPQIGLNFIGHLADGYRETLARMHALMRMEAKYRLLGTLLNLARHNCCIDEAGWFTLHTAISQEDIANMAALNRTTASLLINEFRRQGVLGGSGRSLSINRNSVEQLLQEAGLEILV